jgi:TfoX/Sxy family transcriptional regulator of competence genes
MVYSEKMASRVREALSHLPKVEERKMFRGMTFVVDGKMCVSGENLMVRIDPQEHEAAIRRKGARTVNMKGRENKGFVYVNEDGVKAKKDFDYWFARALDFNKRAKAYKKKPVRAHIERVDRWPS